MYHLYYLPGTCSLAVHVALNELGVPFTTESVSVPDGQPRTPEYLAINPRGNVPALKQGDFVLREGAAILSYLLDEHKSDLLPRSGQSRAKALEWLAFANSTLHPAYSRCFFLSRQLGAQTADSPLYNAAIEMVQKHWNDIETSLKGKSYLCGDDCTIADILVTVIANWSTNLKQPISFGENTKALFKRVIARPAYEKAMESEGVSYRIV
jgi:glutathione S-transferase